MTVKALTALQKLWYRRLKEEGFADIEVMDSLGSMDSPMMVQTASSIGARFDSSVEEYYRLARLFLHDAEFESELERHCWQLHSEGIAYREISLSLPAAGFHPYKLFFVQKLIRKTRGRMYEFNGIARSPHVKQMGLFNDG